MQFIVVGGSQLLEVSIPDTEIWRWWGTHKEFKTRPCSLLLTKILSKQILIALWSSSDCIKDHLSLSSSDLICLSSRVISGLILMPWGRDFVAFDNRIDTSIEQFSLTSNGRGLFACSWYFSSPSTSQIERELILLSLSVTIFVMLCKSWLCLLALLVPFSHPFTPQITMLNLRSSWYNLLYVFLKPVVAGAYTDLEVIDSVGTSVVACGIPSWGSWAELGKSVVSLGWLLRSDTSLWRLSMVDLSCCIWSSCMLWRQLGQWKVFIVSLKSLWDSPTHCLWSQASHLPSKKIASCPSKFSAALTIASRQIGQVVDSLPGEFRGSFWLAGLPW